MKSISNDEHALVEILGEKHNYQVGDYVSFIEVEGMDAINKKKDAEPFRITDVVNLKKFKI